MPYASLESLPPAIRLHLPLHAQEIYLSAFNNAWDYYGRHDPFRREEIARRVAWAAVKRRYGKRDEDWVPLFN